MESEQGVDVLVNNAGVMVNQRELTEEGLEKNFSTNTLGEANVACTLLKIMSKCLEMYVHDIVLISQERIY